MSGLLLFLLKSTLSLSLLYIAYRLLMRRETFFKLNRTMLLFVVLYSTALPFLYSPKPLTVHEELQPVFQHVAVSEEPIQAINEPITVPQSPQPITVRETIRPVTVSASTIFTIVYLTGVFVSFLLLAYSIGTVLLLFRKARKTELSGIRLRIVDDERPAFSFGRTILISQNDYENNFEAIITHEQSHIRLGHFYDLMLMEMVKIMFWFNPLVYRIIRDLKEIHEFQADDYALNSGIDATKYQLLIIQKSVGHQKFALANSFNHCRIKNRIIMMNKQKTAKAQSWKVATFLPLLALLLMAFGKPGENVNSKKVSTEELLLDTVKNATPGKLKNTVLPPQHVSIDVRQDSILYCKSGEKASSVKHSSILGTWEMVSFNYGKGETKASENTKAIKLITPTHFTWVRYTTKDNTIYNSAGGTYDFDGENYTENVQFGAKQMMPWLGKCTFKIKIKGDQMFQSGSLSDGMKIEEVWKRL